MGIQAVFVQKPPAPMREPKFDHYKHSYHSKHSEVYPTLHICAPGYTGARADLVQKLAVWFPDPSLHLKAEGLGQVEKNHQQEGSGE